MGNISPDLSLFEGHPKYDSAAGPVSCDVHSPGREGHPVQCRHAQRRISGNGGVLSHLGERLGELECGQRQVSMDVEVLSDRFETRERGRCKLGVLVQVEVLPDCNRPVPSVS